MKIAVYGQKYQENSGEYITTLLEVLKDARSEIFFESNFAQELIEEKILVPSEIETFSSLDKTYDILISIGGDGTILRAITFVRDLNIPIVGINTGRLGFLATIQKDNIGTAIKEVLEGNYQTSERSLLTIETEPKNAGLIDLNFALNEIALSRKNTTSMITVETTLDDEYLTSYWADGLIISTPTGSTGYSLSCGGPVIMPEADNFILTPIAPHNLSARPLVISGNTEIRLKVDGRENKFLVSLDSRLATLDNDTIVIVKKAPFTIKMIVLNNESFLDTLRKKLLWGEDRRN